MKQQWMKWVVIAVLVLMISCAPFTVAECNEEEKQQSCDPQQLDDCRDFMRGQSRQQQQKPSPICCQSLHQMPQDCRCKAIQKLFDQEQRERQDNQYGRQGQQQQQQREQLDRARDLPSRCNAAPGRCDIRQLGIFMPGNIW